jgi:Ni,Fe-hydrogenase III large subunit
MGPLLEFQHGDHFRLADLPRLDPDVFPAVVSAGIGNGWRLLALPAVPQPSGKLLVMAILALESGGALAAVGMQPEVRYPALTPACPLAQAFERELAEQWGLIPDGHPWLKPLRFQPSPRPSAEALRPSPGEAPFLTVTGEAVHEVAVGPVHAGIIEPGHFRFQCHGETVLHLELALGYQHRGIERALLGGPDGRSRHLIETAAGDTTIGHTLAYAQALEIFTGREASERSQTIRAIALELERLANHVGDLGALAGDVGFLPTASFCGRLRGEFLNLTALIGGNRFGRQIVRPGGVRFDLDGQQQATILETVARAGREVAEAVDLLWQAPSVRQRFEETGVLDRADAAALGLVGPVARASGLERDVRREFPSGAYRHLPFRLQTAGGGDVQARAMQRWLEIQQSLELVGDLAGRLPEGPISSPVPDLPPESVAVSLVEGWRGEICHVAVTDARGRFAPYKIVDPSFRNWMGLAVAMRGQAISDFPLCNKSFNLSYCGHDL